MCGVALCSFSWEAFATIFAGLLAVGAAAYVGRLQYRIMLGQQKILGHQTTIEHLKLRSEKFDLRWQVYVDTVNWLRDWWASGDKPAPELNDKYIWAIEQAKFLFRPEVARQLNAWHANALRLKMINQLRDRRISEQQDAALAEEAVALAGVLQDAFRTVGDLFAEDMRLSEFQTALPPLAMQTDGNAD